MHCSETAVPAFHQRGQCGGGVTIGHIDTGVDASHPAMAGKISRFLVANPCGRSSAETAPFDADWHGTATAGIMADIAPEAQFVAASVLNDGNVIARSLLALDWMVDQAPGVLCLAFGFPVAPAVFREHMQALAARDVLVLAAIGNNGAGQVLSPAISADVVAVGSVDAAGLIPAFSGSKAMVPGSVCAKPDLVFGGVDLPNDVTLGGPRALSGTSFSVAQLAGFCALLRGEHPTVSARAMRGALFRSASELGGQQIHRARFGRACPWDAGAALLALDAVEDTVLPLDPVCAGAARLKERLDLVAADHQVDAIIGFSDGEEFARAAAALDEAGDGEIVGLKHSSAGIIRAPAGHIARLMRDRAHDFAVSCDMDRSWFN